MQNMLIAQGPRFRSGAISSLPCGLIDVAPTVLSLFGIEPPNEWDGRILWELYESDRDRPDVTESSEIVIRSVRRGQRFYGQEVKLQWVHQTCYLDRASVFHEEPASWT